MHANKHTYAFCGEDCVIHKKKKLNTMAHKMIIIIPTEKMKFYYMIK